MILADVLIWLSIPFVLITLYYGTKGGFYDTSVYDGNGTAHPVKFEETTCPRRETAGTK